MFREEKNGDLRAMLIERQAHSTEAVALKNLYLQESRLRRRYDQDMKELCALQAECERQHQRRAFQRELEAERAGREQGKKTRTGYAPAATATKILNLKKMKRMPTKMASNLQTLIRRRNSRKNRMEITGKQRSQIRQKILCLLSHCEDKKSASLLRADEPMEVALCFSLGAMNKKELIDRLARQSHQSKEKAADQVDKLVYGLLKELKQEGTKPSKTTNGSPKPPSSGPAKDAK